MTQRTPHPKGSMVVGASWCGADLCKQYSMSCHERKHDEWRDVLGYIQGDLYLMSQETSLAEKPQQDHDPERATNLTRERTQGMASPSSWLDSQWKEAILGYVSKLRTQSQCHDDVACGEDTTVGWMLECEELDRPAQSPKLNSTEDLCDDLEPPGRPNITAWLHEHSCTWMNTRQGARLPRRVEVYYNNQEEWMINPGDPHPTLNTLH